MKFFRGKKRKKQNKTKQNKRKQTNRNKRKQKTLPTGQTEKNQPEPRYMVGKWNILKEKQNKTKQKQKTRKPHPLVRLKNKITHLRS